MPTLVETPTPNWNLSQTLYAHPLNITFNPVVLNVKFDQIADVELSPDGNWMAVSDRGNDMLYLFGLNANREWEKVIQVQKEDLFRISWSPIEPLMALSYDGYVEIWDVERQETLVIQKMKVLLPPHTVWSADGQSIAVALDWGSLDSTRYLVEIYDSHTLELIKKEPEMPGFYRGPHPFSWNMDSENPIMVMGNWDDLVYIKDGIVTAFDKDLGLMPPPFQSFWIEGETFLLVTQEQEDNGKWDGKISLYQGTTQSTEYVMYDSVEIPAMTSADYHPGLKMLATCIGDDLLSVYRVDTGEIVYLQELKIQHLDKQEGHNNHIKVSFDPSGDGLYLYDQDQIVYAELFSP